MSQLTKNLRKILHEREKRKIKEAQENEKNTAFAQGYRNCEKCKWFRTLDCLKHCR